MVRVLYVIDSLVPGGAERSLAAMAPGLIEQGVRLDVLALAAGGSLAGPLREAGAGVVELPWISRRAAVGAVRAEIRARRPDLVHTTLYEADVAGRVASGLLRVPVVSTLANEAYGAAHLASGVQRAKVRAAQALDVVTARRVRRFHAVSEAVATVMAGRLLVRRSRIDVIPRGRPDTTLGRRTAARRAAVRKELGIGDRPLVLGVGRQERQKRFDVLLDAWAGVRRTEPTAVLAIAGRDGLDTTALRARCDDLSLEDVHWLGAREDVPDLLAAADVLAFPSEREGMPGTLIEALALEVPVVASDIAPNREVVGDSAHALVPVGDADGLAAAIGTALATPDAERVRIGRRRFEERFEIGAVAAAMAAFYARVLGR